MGQVDIRPSAVFVIAEIAALDHETSTMISRMVDYPRGPALVGVPVAGNHYSSRITRGTRYLATFR